MPRNLLAACLAAVLLAPAAVAQPAPVPLVYVYGFTTGRADFFGTSTAVLNGGRIVLVGTKGDINPPNNLVRGSVSVFERPTPDASWAQTGLWLPAIVNGQGGGAFGSALAVGPGDSLAVVGAAGEYRFRDPQPPAVDVGAMYVFRRTGAPGTTGGWTREARLRDPAGRDRVMGGSSVAVAGRLAAMNIDPSRVRLFRDLGPAGPGGEAAGWAPEATFTLPGGGPHLWQRGTLALADDPAGGERLVAGAFYAGAGAVYVWRNDGPEGGPAAWTQEAVLTRPVPGGAFGVAVALTPDGRLLAVGADEYYVAPYHGRAYVFRRDGDGAGSTWTEEAVLLPPTDALGFGGSVALSTDPVTGDRLLLVAGAGQVYVYRRAVGAGGPSWTAAAVATDTLYSDTASLSGATAAAGYRDAGDRGIQSGRAVVFDLRAALVVAGEAAPEPMTEGAAVSVWPNPARGVASVTLVLPAAGAVEVSVVDALGRVVAVVHRGPLGAGPHRLSVDVRGWAPGVYAVRAVSGGVVAAARFVVAR